MGCDAPCLLVCVACRVTQHRHHVRRPTPAKRPPPAGVRHDRHRGTTTERRLGGRSSAARARLALLPHEGSAVGMWESRVLGEMSTSLWTPFCGVHREAISTVGFPLPNVIDPNLPGRHIPVGVPIIVPGLPALSK